MATKIVNSLAGLPAGTPVFPLHQRHDHTGSPACTVDRMARSLLLF